MGRAFKSDVLQAEAIAQEINALEQRADIMPHQIINCPVEGCNVTYQMYNYMFSDREANLSCLLYGLRVHHPHHPARFVLNEPRSD